MGKKIEYAVGSVMNEMVYLRPSEDKRYGKGKVLCKRGVFKCRCGDEFTATLYNVKIGHTSSCGCHRKKNSSDQAVTHGHTGHPMYGSWGRVRQRCYNKKAKFYRNYGGRGITMSDEFREDPVVWINYLVSLDDYDKRDELNLTIDRIDNNKGYERGNLRWATKLTQRHNQRIRTDFHKRIIIEELLNELRSSASTLRELLLVSGIPRESKQMLVVQISKLDATILKYVHLAVENNNAFAQITKEL